MPEPEECSIACDGRCILLQGGTMEAQAECYEDIYDESVRIRKPIPEADKQKAGERFQKLNKKLFLIVNEVAPDFTFDDTQHQEWSVLQARCTRALIATLYGKNKLGQVPVAVMMEAGKLVRYWPQFYEMNNKLAHGESL